MGLRAAVQALKKAESLKNKVQHCKDLLNDNDAWVCQQQLQKIYQQVLILDLEYALDRKVEQELWNLGFKNYIATLQSQAKDRKNPKRNESQAMLSWCLEAASGFYLTLLQEICTAFDLDLPFRRKGYVYGCTSPWKAVENLSTPHKSSCFYACQYCLVHLGDIARYRNQNKQAELFYRHAVSLSPSSGQPYNQLALLEASRGDKLGTVFHYARSVAVKHPFPVATTNLAKTLSSALNDNSFNVDRKTKLTSQEYVAVFLKFHGILHNIGDLNVAVTYVKLLTETLTALVATESFNSWRLIQMLAINLYAFQHVTGSTIDGADLLTIEQLSSDERIARDCMLDLIAGSLSALLLPVYTIKSTVIDYFALPAIKLCLDWISLKPMVLKETAFTSRLQIWPSLCVLLNGLQSCIVDFKDNQYEKVPLPEDRDLQGFLPLQKAFESLRFTNTVLEGDTIALNKLRAVRILHLGHQLTQYSVNDTTSITIVTLGDIGNEQRFASLIEGAEPSNELMKELEELSLNKERGLLVSTSPVPSESTSSKGSWEADIPENSLEKRVGILKPQGSLERSRDSVTCEAMEGNLEVNSTLTIRKPRQNIAMQAIMRRAETEQKQVTFKNVSPVMMDENINKQKLVSTSPTRTGVREGRTKFQSGGLSPPVLNGASTMNFPIGVQVRPSLMQNQSSTLKAQTIPMHHNQSISVKLPVNIPQPSQITQFAVTTTASVCEQQRPKVTQFGKQGQQGLVQASYQPQTFNVQNPQFSKNFMNTRVPSITALYSMPVSSVGVLSTASQNVGLQPNILQNMQQSVQQNIQQNLNPAKSLHQIMNPSISQSSELHQGIRLSPSSQIVSEVSQTIGIQQKPPAPLQQPQNVETHTHQMQGVMQNNTIRSNGVTVQNQFPNTSAPPNSANNMTNLPNYQKSFQQVSTSNVPNRSMSPTNMSNFQFNFSTNFGQNTYGPIYQKQISPIAYDKSSSQFSFPAQGGPSKAQQTTSNTYPMFRNYETKDFNLWKDTQPPQPPVAWWGSASATQMHSKDTIGVDSFQNWGTSLPPSNMIGKVPLISGNNYQQNPLQNRQCIGSTFDHTRSFELDQKQPQSPGTGNTYSLFSGNSWSSTSQASNPSKEEQAKRRLSQQSLWSGPGPSPLERLLEQQKSLREGGT